MEKETLIEEIISSLEIEKRDYQISAVNEIVDNIHDKSILLNYSYGTGKTIIALLTFLMLKQRNPEAQFIFTSAREAANLRCRQALEMAKKFNFIEKLGYLYDPSGKGLSLRQRSKMYEAASVIFAPITTITRDHFEIKNKIKKDILEKVELIVIDEATDILARNISGYRISKYFEQLFRLRKERNLPILGLSGTQDRQKAQLITNFLKPKGMLMQRLDLSPYETITTVRRILREDYIKIDKQLSTLITKPIETIQLILDKKLSRLEIIKMSYGGILERLTSQKGSFPIKVSKYTIKTKEEKEELIHAFVKLFKLMHARLLLLESTPGQFIKYIEKEENREIFQYILAVSKEIGTYRVEMPFFDNPDEKTTRGFIHPKVYTAVEIIYEHLIKGAQIILFTRYLALGNQIDILLKALKFPDVSYLSGKTTEELRRKVIQDFEEGEVKVLIFTPVGGRGLNLAAGDVVIHLDITTNLDVMVQRRERARGCLEYVLVLEGTSEDSKVKGYLDLQEEIQKTKNNE